MRAFIKEGVKGGFIFHQAHVMVYAPGQMYAPGDVDLVEETGDLNSVDETKRKRGDRETCG